MKFHAYLSAMLLTVLCLLTTSGIAGDGRARTEKEKFEALIAGVEGLKDASFIRNGPEYNAAAAAKFLRGKWKAPDAAIKTAANFIDRTARVSSTLGKPWLIRFKDGRETKSGDFLKARLQLLEKSGSARSEPYVCDGLCPIPA